MENKLIADFEIEFIEQKIKNLDSLDWEKAIPDLIARLRAAEEVIKFYATPGNVVGSFTVYNERSVKEPQQFTKVGELAKTYFARCSRSLS